MQPRILVVFAVLSVLGTASEALSQQKGCRLEVNGQLVPETKAGIANFAKTDTSRHIVKFNKPFCKGVTPIVVLTPYKRGGYSIVDPGYYVTDVSEEGFEIVSSWPGGSGDANISLTGWVAVQATETLPTYTAP